MALVTGQLHYHDERPFACGATPGLPATRLLPALGSDRARLAGSHSPSRAAGRCQEPAAPRDRLHCHGTRVEKSLRHAVVVAHANIWGGDALEEVLLPQISAPLRVVSAHVELPPVLTCAAVYLWNYTVTDPSRPVADPDALSVPITFMRTESEAWFQRIDTAIESHGGPVVGALLTAPARRPQRRRRRLGARHCRLAPAAELSGANHPKPRAHTRPLRPAHLLPPFATRFGPFYEGSKDLRAAGLPHGVFYSTDAREGSEWMRLPGGSNGQSALIQLFDIILGLGSGSGGCGRREEYHLGTRAGTPGPHWRFLEWAAQAGSIRALALCEGVNTKEQARLTAAFAGAAEAMGGVSYKHIQIVTRYIAMPNKTAVAEIGAEQELAAIAAIRIGR